MLNSESKNALSDKRSTMANPSPQPPPMPPVQSPSPMAPPQPSPSPSNMMPPTSQPMVPLHHPHNSANYPSGPPPGMMNHMNGPIPPNVPPPHHGQPYQHPAGPMPGPHPQPPSQVSFMSIHEKTYLECVHSWTLTNSESVHDEIGSVQNARCIGFLLNAPMYPSANFHRKPKTDSTIAIFRQHLYLKKIWTICK